MSETEFHYVRTTGVDGGVDAVDGRAIGESLETILNDGLPPFKVALEIIAALCEILDISDQDGEIHGDIHPSQIFLDDTGAVSVEGFGIERDQTDAPEGRPDGTLTDLYGLGYTAYRLLAPRDLKDLPDDPDGHDDAVIDAVVALPWGDMPEEWVGDIQWFLAKLMSFEPEERPTAVDAWRTFIAFSEEAEGTSVVDWAPEAIEGGGERRDASMAVRPAAEEDEDLGGPVVKSGPLSKGAVSFGGGGAKSGQATAFWSKDQMKAALEAEEEEEEEAFKPQVGGGAATSFWTRDQMEAMARGDDSAPRPKRKEGGKKPARKPAPPPAAPSPPGQASKPPQAPPAAPSPPPSAPQPPPPASPPPVAAGPGADIQASGPTAGPAIAQPGPGPGAPAMDDEDEGGGGGMKIAIIGAVIVLLLLTCTGIGGIAIAVPFLWPSGDDASESSSSSSASSRDDDDDDGTMANSGTDDSADMGSDDTGSAEDEGSADDGGPSAVDSKPEPKPKPTTTSKPKPKPRRTTRRKPKPKAPSGPARVLFTVPGDGSVRCGDGTRNDASGGRASLIFKPMPADGVACTYYDGSNSPVCAGFLTPGTRKCECAAGSDSMECK